MNVIPWAEVRAAFKGHKRGEQLVQTCTRFGFPPPNGHSRGTPGECRVDWFNKAGDVFHLDTSMTNFGFREPGQPERAHDADPGPAISTRTIRRGHVPATDTARGRG